MMERGTDLIEAILRLTHTIEVLSIENGEQTRTNREMHERMKDADDALWQQRRRIQKLEDEVEDTRRITEIKSKTAEMYRVEDIIFESIGSLIQLGVQYANNDLTYDEAVLAGKRMMHMKITGEEMRLEGPEDDCCEDEYEEDS